MSSTKHFSRILLFFIFMLVPVQNSFSQNEIPQELVNGLNPSTLNGLKEFLETNPDKGRVTFYSNARWQDGMRSFTNFSGFKVDGEMKHQNTRSFTLLGDEPTEFSASDAAPGAVEELMYALSTCIIAAAAANATMMGVNLTRLEVVLESDIDLHGLFGVDPKVRPGLTDLRAEITIDGDADEKTLEEIALLGYRFSPVSETTKNGIKFKPVVNVTKNKKEAE